MLAQIRINDRYLSKLANPTLDNPDIGHSNGCSSLVQHWGTQPSFKFHYHSSHHKTLVFIVNIGPNLKLDSRPTLIINQLSFRFGAPPWSKVADQYWAKFGYQAWAGLDCQARPNLHQRWIASLDQSSTHLTQACAYAGPIVIFCMGNGASHSVSCLYFMVIEFFFLKNQATAFFSILQIHNTVKKKRTINYCKSAQKN